MKKCSYCGAEYPDDMVVCPIDQTPFEDAHSATVGLVPPVAERKIPVSLSVVSYLFLIPGAMGLAGFILGIFGLVYFGFSKGDGVLFLFCLFALAYGIFFVSLSRGLRRCARGWRTCALVWIWLGFIVIVFLVGRFFVTSITLYHMPASGFLLTYGFGFVVRVWQYRVLTRSDVRELFDYEP